MASDEKKEINTIQQSPPSSIRVGSIKPAAADDEFEVFKQTTDGVQFRLVGWIKASVIFLKSKLLLVWVVTQTLLYHSIKSLDV